MRARYLAPASLDDELDTQVVPTRLGTTEMTTRMEVRRGDRLLVEGEMRQVFVDTATRRKCPIPEAVRRRLEPGLCAPGGEGTSVERHAAAGP